MPQISTSISSSVFYRKLGSGTALILLHGFPESGTLWQNIWEELSQSFTIIIPDFPGSGHSKLEKETGIGDMATCLKEIMDAEGINVAVIAGHSMGGYVALAFAGLYPYMVKGMSLIHSTPEADDAEKIKGRLKSIELIKKGAKSVFITHMIPNLFATVFVEANPVAVQVQVAEGMKMEDAGMINFYNAMIARTDHTHVLKSGQFPVQWIVGKDDNIIPFKKMLEHANNSNINFVSFYHNCGHMSMIEMPQKLICDLRSFVTYCYLRR